MGNGRYKRLATLTQCHKVNLVQTNLYPANATLIFLYEVIYNNNNYNRCKL